jgi:hypothetical protein
LDGQNINSTYGSFNQNTKVREYDLVVMIFKEFIERKFKTMATHGKKLVRNRT